MAKVKQRPVRFIQPRRAVNYSMQEAAKILGYDMEQLMWLVHRQRIRVYKLSGFVDSRMTILDLYEYSFISGRRLNFQ